MWDNLNLFSKFKVISDPLSVAGKQFEKGSLDEWKFEWLGFKSKSPILPIFLPPMLPLFH